MTLWTWYKKQQNPWIIYSTGIPHASEWVCLQPIYRSSCKGNPAVTSGSENWELLFTEIPICSYSSEYSLWSDLLWTRDHNSSLYCHNRDLLYREYFLLHFLESTHTAVPPVFMQLFCPSASSPLVVSWPGPHTQISHQPNYLNAARLSLWLLFHLGHKLINISKLGGYRTSSAY